MCMESLITLQNIVMNRGADELFCKGIVASLYNNE